MNVSDLRRILERPTDLLFIALFAFSLLLAIGGLTGGLDRRDTLLLQGTARKVDVEKVRKQISESDLSAHKAMFFKKITE